jgi:hypothetical protein
MGSVADGDVVSLGDTRGAEESKVRILSYVTLKGVGLICLRVRENA